MRAQLSDAAARRIEDAKANENKSIKKMDSALEIMRQRHEEQRRQILEQEIREKEQSREEQS